MCTTSGACGCGGGGSGVSGSAVLATVLVLAAISATYQLFAMAPYFFLAIYLVVAVCAWKTGRQIVGGGLKLTAAGVLWLARRRRAPKPAAPSTEVAVPRVWQVTVYEPAGGANLVLTRGEVEGTWRSSTEVEAETIARAVTQFGWEKAGQLRAHAQLAVTR
jgi:hypothetical protein